MPHRKGAKPLHHKPYRGPWPEEHKSVPGRAGLPSPPHPHGEAHPVGATHGTFQKIPVQTPKPAGGGRTAG